MWDWVNMSAVQVVVSVVLLLALIYGGWQAILTLRPSTCKVDTGDAHLVRNFEEMRLEGGISDEELRNIRSVLGKTRERNAGDATPLDAGNP